MKKYILGICIASYNRKDVIIPDLKEYFSLDDQRFKVIVQDDGSNNGTLEELEAIKDPRLTLRVNPHNLGALPNAFAALSNNEDCEYVMNLNDKDCVHIDVLPKFLDYLEKEKPNYGFVRVYGIVENYKVERFDKGVPSINSIAYTCEHPSGYFWKSDLFGTETAKDYYKALNPKFDYQFDLLFAHCAVSCGGVILSYPLITMGAKRKEQKQIKTQTYNEDNFYFGFKERAKTFGIFINDVKVLHILEKDKKCCLDRLVKLFSDLTTYRLRAIFRNESVCYHYGLQSRNVSFFELHRNIIGILNIFLDNSKDYSWLFRASIVTKYYLRFYAITFYLALLRKN